MYCVYTDYEEDHRKPYTTVLGYKVKDLDTVPEGLTGITVPGKMFEVFTASGNLAEGAVFKEWTKIWNASINRAYSGDFEVYGAKSQDQEKAEVDIYIALQ
jgi:predicted transcriptional regulator YdeE